MRRIVLFLSILLIISGCNSGKRKDIQQHDPDAFIAGEFTVDENAFGEVIELRGNNIRVEAIFSFAGTQVSVKDSILILKNDARGGNTHIVQFYTLPNLEFIAEMGTAGRGPHEFSQNVDLVRTSDTSAITYLYDVFNKEVYKVSNTFSLNKVTDAFKKIDIGTYSPHGLTLYTIGGVLSFSEADYVFTDRINDACTLWRLRLLNDSLSLKKLADLDFRPDIKTLMAYNGYASANFEKNRIVYAYMYYKRLLFMDISTDDARIVSFRAAEYDPNTANFPDGENLNMTHYFRNIVAGDKYLYLTYLGKIGEEYSNEIKNGIYTQYLEQWDWNGNPIRKFKLDRLGFVTVDEKNKKIYLVSSFDEFPFFVYDLPD